VVEHLPHPLKAEGLSPAAARRLKMAKKKFCDISKKIEKVKREPPN